MKLCKKCDTLKEPVEFYKHKQTRDGYETTCKQCMKETARRWALENPEKNKAKDKRYVARHPERRKETVAKYYQANKEHLNERVKQSRLKNKELYAELGRKHANIRRARKLDNGTEPYTEKQMLDKYGYLCHICNEGINFAAPRRVGLPGWERGLHIDHLVPLAKGGADTLENVRPSHGLCNLEKSML